MLQIIDVKQEREQKEIALHGYNPNALYTMLAFCYQESNEVANAPQRNRDDATMFYLLLHEVANKYDIPLLRKTC